MTGFDHNSPLSGGKPHRKRSCEYAHRRRPQPFSGVQVLQRKDMITKHQHTLHPRYLTTYSVIQTQPLFTGVQVPSMTKGVSGRGTATSGALSRQLAVVQTKLSHIREHTSDSKAAQQAARGFAVADAKELLHLLLD